MLKNILDHNWWSEKIINIPEEGRNTITVEGFSNYVFGDIDDDIGPMYIRNSIFRNNRNRGKKRNNSIWNYK